MDVDGRFEVEIAEARNADDSPAIAVMLRSATTDLSVWLSLAEAMELLGAFRGIEKVRKYTAGTSANAKVHWSLIPGRSLFIRVGFDDETWDFGVTLGKEDCDSLIQGLAEECARAA